MIGARGALAQFLELVLKGEEQGRGQHQKGDELIEERGGGAQEQERADVARRVREAIDRSGLTASDFALQVGTSASRLSTYASGRVMPSASMLLRIDRATEVLGG